MTFLKNSLFALLFFTVSLSLWAQTSALADTSEFVIVANIQIVGNKTTKPSIIKRELLFDVGDTILQTDLKQVLATSKNNVYNTLLFNDVKIDYAYINQKHIQVVVLVTERWYLWPGLIFRIEDTNFNTWWLTKDWQRVNYGFFVRHENFRGRKEKLALKVQSGYTEQFGILYDIPYVNKKKTIGLGAAFNYVRNHQITVSTQNNKRVFYREYPSYPYKEVKAEMALTFRPEINNTHNLKLEYLDVLVSDSVLYYAGNYISDQQQTQLLGLHYFFKSDFRDNRNYPLRGYYFDVEAGQHGFGLFTKRVNTAFLISNVRYFTQLSNRWYFSQGWRVKATVNNPGYYFLSTLGYGNTVVRGYEYYVITGQHYGLFKTQLRYNLIKPAKVHLPFIPFQKFATVPYAFYLGFYFDNGYVWDNGRFNNSLANTWLYGGGISLDFVSYYDFVLRTEFSINRQNQTGIYLHFVAPI